MDRPFYVYIYLDPRKAGDFHYGMHHFEYEPFYVGKGKGGRMFDHLKRKGRNYLKNKILKDLAESGLEPIIFKVKDKVSNDIAMELEIALIKSIGRLINSLGPLTNITEGGEGSLGVVQTIETKEKRVESLKKSSFYETVRGDEFRENVSEFFKNYYKDPRNREQLRELKLGPNNPMYGKTTSEYQKKVVSELHKEGKIKLSEEGRFRIIENNKKRRGKKNQNKRCDTIRYELSSPFSKTYHINGAKNLQKICRKMKLQYHTLKNNINTTITEEMVVGKRIYAINTIKWKLKKIN